MPWGWECRAKLIKQRPAKPSVRRGHAPAEAPGPAPNQYELPEIFCGKGFSKVKRAPAYTFGHRTPCTTKPVTTNARMFNVQGLGKKGPFRITHSVVGEQYNVPRDKLIVPGPGAYVPYDKIRYKKPPEYSLRPAARPPYEPWDQWTPAPNMYCPPQPGRKKAPAYTFGYMVKSLKSQDLPGPGQHDPRFEYVAKTKPAFSFGAPFKPLKLQTIPSPNVYCEKRFMYPKRSIPAPSFGIRHSPFLGKQEEFMKPSKLQLNIV